MESSRHDPCPPRRRLHARRGPAGHDDRPGDPRRDADVVHQLLPPRQAEPDAQRRDADGAQRLDVAARQLRNLANRTVAATTTIDRRAARRPHLPDLGPARKWVRYCLATSADAGVARPRGRGCGSRRASRPPPRRRHARRAAPARAGRRSASSPTKVTNKDGGPGLRRSSATAAGPPPARLPGRRRGLPRITNIKAQLYVDRTRAGRPPSCASPPASSCATRTSRRPRASRPCRTGTTRGLLLQRLGLRPIPRAHAPVRLVPRDGRDLAHARRRRARPRSSRRPTAPRSSTSARASPTATTSRPASRRRCRSSSSCATPAACTNPDEIGGHPMTRPDTRARGRMGPRHRHRADGDHVLRRPRVVRVRRHEPDRARERASASRRCRSPRARSTRRASRSRRAWPNATQTPLTADCSSRSGTTQVLPRPRHARRGQPGNTAVAQFSSTDFQAGSTWTTKVRDNSGALAAPTTRRWPTTRSTIPVYGACPSTPCRMDWNRDHQLWVQSQCDRPRPAAQHRRAHEARGAARERAAAPASPPAASTSPTAATTRWSTRTGPASSCAATWAQAQCANCKSRPGRRPRPSSSAAAVPPLMTPSQLVRVPRAGDHRRPLLLRLPDHGPRPANTTSRATVVWVEHCDKPPNFTNNVQTVPCTGVPAGMKHELHQHAGQARAC